MLFSKIVTIFLECATAEIGRSTENSITTAIANGYKCPTSVDKTNWLGGHDYPDKFSITQNGDEITIHRTDASSGWSMDLRFICCKEKGIRMFIIF